MRLFIPVLSLSLTRAGMLRNNKLTLRSIRPCWTGALMCNYYRRPATFSATRGHIQVELVRSVVLYLSELVKRNAVSSCITCLELPFPEARPGLFAQVGKGSRCAFPGTDLSLGVEVSESH